MKCITTALIIIAILFTTPITKTTPSDHSESVTNWNSISHSIPILDPTYFIKDSHYVLNKNSRESVTDWNSVSNRIPLSKSRGSEEIIEKSQLYSEEIGKRIPLSKPTDFILNDKDSHYVLNKNSRESVTNWNSVSNRIPLSDETASTSNNWQIYTCLSLGILGKPARRGQKRNDISDSDQMDEIYQQEEACLILGEIAKFILEKPDRTRILHAISHDSKTFGDLQIETKMTEKTLYKYLKQLQRAGFVDRTDTHPLQFMWSEALKEYYSLAQQHSKHSNQTLS
jgi:DNA-binding HxlR family transcriptional regulator